MRRNINAFIPVFIMLVVAIVCGIMYMFFTDKLPKHQNDNKTAKGNN